MALTDVQASDIFENYMRQSPDETLKAAITKARTEWRTGRDYYEQQARHHRLESEKYRKEAQGLHEKLRMVYIESAKLRQLLREVFRADTR